MNPNAWKTASDMSPSPEYPGVTALPPTIDDATKVIWHDPSSYDPFFHGPPYLPGMKVRTERTASAKVRLAYAQGAELPALLTLLRALSMVHQSHHWLTKGAAFYADHLLFERLYNDIVPEIDGIGERAVGSGCDRTLVHPGVQAQGVTRVIEALCGNGITFGEGENSESYVATSLKAEKWFLVCARQLAESMKATNELSRGTDNLVAGIEDKHEEHVYLLSQRSNTASWKAP